MADTDPQQLPDTSDVQENQDKNIDQQPPANDVKQESHLDKDIDCAENMDDDENGQHSD